MQDATTEVFGVTAGLGAGKTHGLTQWHHYLTTLNRESRFSGFLMPSYQKIHDAGLPTYQKVLDTFGLVKDRDYKIIKSPFPKLIYLDRKVKHEVHFLTAESPKNIVAVEFSHGTEDESGAIEREASDNFRSRIRDPNATRSQLFRGGAPQGINDFAAQFDSYELPGWNTRDARDHYQEERRQRRFILWTDDNPYLKSSYLRLLDDTYGHNPNLLKSYRYGLFCALSEGVAISNYMPQKHDLELVVKDPFREIDLTFDFNANPMTWLAIQYQPIYHGRKETRRYVVVAEADQGADQLEDAVCEFSAKFPLGHFKDTPINIYGDRSGHAGSHKVRGSDYERIYKILKELGYHNVTIRASKQVALEVDSVEALQWMFAHNLLGVYKELRSLKRSLMATKWRDGVRKLDKPAGETHTHATDALKYWAWQQRREGNLDGTKVYGAN